MSHPSKIAKAAHLRKDEEINAKQYKDLAELFWKPRQLSASHLQTHNQLLDRIFGPSKSIILNRSNINHYVAMCRGVAIHKYNIDKDIAHWGFTRDSVHQAWRNQTLPAEFVEDELTAWADAP